MASRTAIEDILGKTAGTSSINQKQKGNVNERAAAKWLAKWTGSHFARTPSSGGLRWKNTPDVCGDVLCTDKEFPWNWAVETKHLKEFKIVPELTHRSKIATVWQQAKSDAERASREPLLMIRKNGMKAGTFYVFFNFDTVKPLLRYMRDTKQDMEIIRGVWKDFKLAGLRSEELQLVPYKVFVELVKI